MTMRKVPWTVIYSLVLIGTDINITLEVSGLRTRLWWVRPVLWDPNLSLKQVTPYFQTRSSWCEVVNQRAKPMSLYYPAGPPKSWVHWAEFALLEEAGTGNIIEKRVGHRNLVLLSVGVLVPHFGCHWSLFGVAKPIWLNVLLWRYSQM